MYFFNVFKLSKITRNAVTEKLNRSRISNRRKSEREKAIHVEESERSNSCIGSVPRNSNA